MHRLSTLLLVFLVAGIFAAKDKDDQPLTITGKVQFPGGSRLPIEKDAQLTVKLQDVSLMDAPSKLIAQTTAKLVRFPASFTIKYSSKQIEPFNSYSLSAVVENKKKELLYINDVSVRVQPIGADRTKTKDIPVKQIKKFEKPQFQSPVLSKKQWPELVGKKGEDAVKIIKKQTGFKNVRIVKPTDPLFQDPKNKYIFVYVDGKGIVRSAPTTS